MKDIYENIQDQDIGIKVNQNETKPAKVLISNRNSFAKGLNFYKLHWIVFIGSFFGVILETILFVLFESRVESRQGLIYGPFNLVYGIGALVMTVCLYWLREKSDIYIFMGGVVLGSVFEYVCSWFQETVFGTVSWQYDHIIFNLNGRINLVYSIFWGFLTLLWMRVLYPKLSDMIESVPNKPGVIVSWILFVFMLFNTVISAVAVYRMSERRENIPADSSIEEFLDEQYPDEYLKKIYPSMRV